MERQPSTISSQSNPNFSTVAEVCRQRRSSDENTSYSHSPEECPVRQRRPDISTQANRSTHVLNLFSCTDVHDGCRLREHNGRAKINALLRYQNAAKQALVAADWIRSTDLVILQAFTLFLLSTRPSYDLQTFSILTGTCVRVAQRIGIHREKLLARYSAFDAEMDRRLWWQIGFLESKAADVAGVSNMTAVGLWDTKLPANLNDSDLSPQMSQLPTEHIGPTEMVFCLVRCYVGEFQRTCPLLNGTWELLVRTDFPTEEKDKVIVELETLLQSKTLCNLDCAIPLHLLTMGAALSFVDRLKLLCQHPRLYPDRQMSMCSTDKDRLFDLCLSVVQRDNWGHSVADVQGYRWHIDSQFQSDTFIYLLHELRFHCISPRADATWPQILKSFGYHPEILHSTRNSLWVAIGNLTLKSWTTRERALAAQNRHNHPATGTEESLPQAITILRAQRLRLGKSFYNPDHAGVTPLPTHPSYSLTTANTVYQGIQDNGVTNDAIESEWLMAPYFDTNDSVEMMYPIDWTYWNNLVQASKMLTYES